MESEVSDTPYIYRYKDANDAIRYVGIIKVDRNFPQRFYQHKRDEWYASSTSWTVEYAYYDSRSDVELLEAHLIAVYTDKGYALFNVAKTGWGRSGFIDEDSLEWQTFVEPIYPKIFTGKRFKKEKPCIEEYIELGACYKLLQLLARKTSEKSEKICRLNSKERNRMARMRNGITDMWAHVNWENYMIEDVDPTWKDKTNDLLNVFPHEFDRDSPIASIVTDKGVEILYEMLFEVSGYSTKRELSISEMP